MSSPPPKTPYFSFRTLLSTFWPIISLKIIIMSGVIKKWFNKFGRSSHSAESESNSTEKNSHPAPDPGDKRKKIDSQDSQDSDKHEEFKPLDKKQKLLDGKAKKVDLDIKNQTSTPSLFKNTHSKSSKNTNLTFQQKYQNFSTRLGQSDQTK